MNKEISKGCLFAKLLSTTCFLSESSLIPSTVRNSNIKLASKIFSEIEVLLKRTCGSLKKFYLTCTIKHK